jgi:hypothetical protein
VNVASERVDKSGTTRPLRWCQPPSPRGRVAPNLPYSFTLCPHYAAYTPPAIRERLRRNNNSFFKFKRPEGYHLYPHKT